MARTNEDDGTTNEPTSSRRAVLGLAAGTGLSAIAGCLNSTGGGGDATTTQGEALADKIVLQMEGGTMLDALESEAFDAFEEEFGTSVEVSLRSSQQSGYAKIQAGQAEVDFASVPPFTLYNGTKDDVWEPIDPDEVPNYESNVLDPLKNPVFDPGDSLHGIPHAYGTVGMAYNNNELDDPTSWSACWDSAYDGHVAPEGFGFIRVFTTALEMGMDPNDIGADSSYEEAIEKIWDRVAEQQELVVTNWTSGDEQARLFASKDAWVGEAWGNVIYGAVQDGNDHLSYTIPDEGAYGYTQNHALVKGISDKKRRTVLEFINFLLRDEILQPVTEKLGLPPSTSVTSEEIENLYDYDPQGGEGLKFPDVEYINEHNDEWSQRWESVRGN
jgi:spermidine/putrescine transport system substrate-binding protein